MKTNILSMIFALFALVMISSLANAALELTPTSIPDQLDHNKSTTITFTLRNTGTVDQTGLTWTQSTLSQGTLTLPTLTSIPAGETRSLSASVNIAKHLSGTSVLTLDVDSAQGESDTLAHTFTIRNAPQVSFTKTQDLGINKTGIFQIKNEGNTALDLTLLETSTYNVALSEASMTLAPGAVNTVTVSLPSNTDLEFGSNPVVIKVQDASKGFESTFSFILSGSFCKSGPQGGHLEITKVDISNVEGEGDDNEWKLLDEIEVEVEVENMGDDDLNDIFVELGFFDSDGNNQVNDLDFDSAEEEEMDLGDIDENKEETATFRFRVPADIEDGSYKLTVKAYSDDLGENEECVDVASDLSDGSFEDIDVQREDDEGKFIAFEDIVVTPLEAVCGETVTLSADVFNIGEDSEDQVRISLSNTEMKVDESFEIRKDLDQGDNERVEFQFTVPQGVTNKRYDLFLTAEYDYNNGNYRESLDEDVRVPFTVLGCADGDGNGGSSDNIAAITASLDSEAMAGEQLIVSATITSLKSGSSTFVIGAEDYQSWATLSDVSNRIIVLGQGESEVITFTFDVDEDAVGEQSFTIDVVSGDDTESREVIVELEEVSKPSFNLGGNTALWIILGVVNIILIILIIVVAVRISRR